jgi:hypothetical protein
MEYNAQSAPIISELIGFVLKHPHLELELGLGTTVRGQDSENTEAVLVPVAGITITGSADTGDLKELTELLEKHDLFEVGLKIAIA